MKKFLRIGGGFAAGVVVCYGVLALISVVVRDVLQIGVSTADRRSLFILVIIKTVPLVSAMATALWIATRPGKAKAKGSAGGP